jgi:hypothetical protein
MNDREYVYVVLDCAWRDGSSVAGAATDLDSAKGVADVAAAQLGYAEITGWAEWKERDGEWIRDALTVEGIHASAYQEIVRTALTGSLAVSL